MKRLALLLVPALLLVILTAPKGQFQYAVTPQDVAQAVSSVMPTTEPDKGLGQDVPEAKARRVLPAPLPMPDSPAAAPGGKKCYPTDPVNITAHFWDTTSGYWKGQYKNMHNGTDYGAPEGRPVYAPFNMTIDYIGYYGDPGRIGYFIQAHLDDHWLFYSGHLGSTMVSVGDYVPACTQIGTIGVVNHTHIKIASPDKPVPCEATGCDDFEAYFNEH